MIELELKSNTPKALSSSWKSYQMCTSRKLCYKCMYISSICYKLQLAKPTEHGEPRTTPPRVHIYSIQPSLASSLSRTCKRQALGSTACNWNEEKRTMKINAWTMGTCAHTEKNYRQRALVASLAQLVSYTLHQQRQDNNRQPRKHLPDADHLEHRESTKNTLVQNKSCI